SRAPQVAEMGLPFVAQSIVRPLAVEPDAAVCGHVPVTAKRWLHVGYLQAWFREHGRVRRVPPGPLVLHVALQRDVQVMGDDFGVAAFTVRDERVEREGVCPDRLPC